VEAPRRDIICISLKHVLHAERYRGVERVVSTKSDNKGLVTDGISSIYGDVLVLNGLAAQERLLHACLPCVYRIQIRHHFIWWVHGIHKLEISTIIDFV